MLDEDEDEDDGGDLMSKPDLDRRATSASPRPTRSTATIFPSKNCTSMMCSACECSLAESAPSAPDRDRLHMGTHRTMDSRLKKPKLPADTMLSCSAT